MSKEVVDMPEFIVMVPDTTYSALFWDDDGAAIDLSL